MCTKSDKQLLVTSLVAAVLFCPILLHGDIGPITSIPGDWEPVGASVEPGGVMPPFGGDSVHRPAVAIRPFTGQPAAVVHTFKTWELAGVDDAGDLVRIDCTSGESETVNPVDYPGYFGALAFDSNSDVVYGVASGNLIRIEPQTGQATDVAFLGWDFQGLTFDPENGVLYAAVVSPSGEPGEAYMNLFRIAPESGQMVLAASSVFACEDVAWLTALAFDTSSNELFAVIREYVSGYQLAAIDVLTAEVARIGSAWGESNPVEGLAFDEATGVLYGAYGTSGPLLRIDPGSGSVVPVGPGLWSGVRGLCSINRQQDCLCYVEYDEAADVWQTHAVENEQDGVLIDGCMTHSLIGGDVADANQGRIDGMSVAYQVDGGQQHPLIAWSQRVNDLYSEILVARGVFDGWTYVFEPLGGDGFGTPSNRVPGISRTLRDSTDPILLLDGEGKPLVAWRETTAPGQHEIYVRRYDPIEDQWLEMGDFSASYGGVSQSLGTADSFDMAVYQGSVLLAHAHDGHIVLKRWDETMELWVDFSPGSALPGPDSVSGEEGGADSQPTIAVYPDSQELFIAWVRNDTQVVGKPWFGMDWAFAAEAIHVAERVLRPSAMVTFGGELVVAWQEEQTTPWSQVLAKYRDDGLWSEIGPGSSSSGGISASPAPSLHPRLAVGPDARAVIAWEEDGLAFLRRFSPALEPDCDSNGRTDSIDLWLGASSDCNGNSVPDQCEFFDGNRDGNVDRSDYAMFAGCMTGPGAGPPAGGCEAFDGNCDAAVDLHDFAAFQIRFTASD